MCACGLCCCLCRNDRIIDTITKASAVPPSFWATPEACGPVGCTATLAKFCGAVQKNYFDCVLCAGNHQSSLKEEGCTNAEIDAFCRVGKPPAATAAAASPAAVGAPAAASGPAALDTSPAPTEAAAAL